MRLCHIAFALLVSAAAFAAEVHLGPELPVTVTIQTAPAAFAQQLAAIASNGRDFLAIWYDRREQSGDSRMYTSRLDVEGRPFQPYGRPFEPGSGVKIASDGNDYLAVWRARYPEPLLAQRLNENGVPAGVARSLGPDVFPLDLKSNGSTYLLVTNDTANRLSATLLDHEGVVLQTRALPLSRFLAFTVHEGRYDILGTAQGGSRLVLQTIEDHAGVMNVATTPLGDVPPYSVAAMARDRIVLAWSPTTSTVWIRMLDRKGTILIPDSRTNLPGSSTVDLFFDGSAFLLISNDRIVMQIHPDGSMAETAPIALPSSRTIASNGTTFVMLSTEGMYWTDADVVSRAFRSFDELADAPPPAIVASSGLAQHNVRIARAGEHQMTVWIDGTLREIRGTIDGTELLITRQPAAIGSPSVTAGEHCFLVAWNESRRTVARRYAFDGTPLDKQPIVIASDTGRHFLDDDPGVAADRTSFVVSDDSQGMLRLLRIDGRTGVVSEEWTRACEFFCVGSFPPMKISSEWVIPYMRYVGFFSPHVSQTWGVSIARSSFSDDIRMNLSGDDGYLLKLGVARAGENVTVALPVWRDIQLIRTHAGVPEFGAKIAEVAAAAEIAWNGTEYVLVWSTYYGGPIRAIRLNASLAPLDSAPFDVVAAGSTTANPSIAVTGDGVVIAYSRSTAENGWAPRAFTRTLDRLDLPIVRRRAARH